jgi:D-glycerate 3-kinase
MMPEALFEALGADAERAGVLLQRLPADAPPDWRLLAAGLVSLPTLPGVLGISGGQGAGKSTLSELLVRAAAEHDRRALILSLDDFYLTREERARLGRDVHPLLATRGVPGTHDVLRLTEAVALARSSSELALPVFDKGADDRAPGSRRVRGPFDLVVLEGWCIGAPPQPEPELTEPCNALEAELDPDGRWRRYVNGCLATTYAELWTRLDELVFLAVPDLGAVVRWRLQQENERPEDQRMSEADVARFVAHYERLTRWMLAVLPDSAGIVGYLDGNHRLERVVRRG